MALAQRSRNGPYFSASSCPAQRPASDQPHRSPGQELELASLLMAQLPGVDLTALHDDYAAALQQLVAAKASGSQLMPPA
jgi:hypothetical protein